MLNFFLFLGLISHLSHRLEKPQGAEGALLSTQLGTQRIHRSWLEGRAAVNSNISAGISVQGTPALSDRCWGTWDTNSIIIKENLFHLWV